MKCYECKNSHMTKIDSKVGKVELYVCSHGDHWTLVDPGAERECHFFKGRSVKRP